MSADNFPAKNKIKIQKGTNNQEVIFKVGEESYNLSAAFLSGSANIPLKIGQFYQSGEQLLLDWLLNEQLILKQVFYFSESGERLEARFDATIFGSQNEDGVLIQTLALSSAAQPYFMIPGMLYGSNNIKNSKSIQPQLNYRGDLCYPKTPVIYTRADRSTHNAVISVTDKRVVGMRVNERSVGTSSCYNGLGVDTRPNDGSDRIGISFGYLHFPVQYRGKLYEESHSMREVRSPIPINRTGEWRTSGHIYFDVAENNLSYQSALKYFYYQIHQFPSNKEPRKKAINDLTSALIENCYDWKHHYFPTVLSGTNPDSGTSGDMAWTGGLQVAYPLAVASRHVPQAKDLVIDFVENLIKHGVNHNAKMFYEGKDGETWKVCGWWKKDIEVYDQAMNRLPEAHSAYINGQATCYLLKTYQIAKKDNWPVERLDQWLSTCIEIIDGVIEQQRFDGALGCYFDPKDGRACEYNSFQGSWFLAGIAELAKLTGDKKYFKAFERGNDFYWQFHKNVELWGMPIDTRDAVDQEGNLAYVTALKTMHEVTGDNHLIDQLVHALHYDFSWKFAYNTEFANEPLRSLRWPSSGGCITSSHNIHIHQMGNLICEEMYYAYQQTGDDYIKSRLKDTLNWGLGTHNPSDNYFGFGQAGWATEQFFHSDGRQDDPSRIEDGGIWYDYLSWAAACTLLSSAIDIEDSFYY